MTTDDFSEPADAFEAAFYSTMKQYQAKQSEETAAKSVAAQELAELTGIREPSTLAALSESGVTVRSLVAMRIFPLVAVAWADGEIQPDERERVLEAAAQQGLKRKSSAGILLNEWLMNQPDESVFEAWEHYAIALLQKLSPADAATLRKSIQDEIKDVAAAAGGVLGWAAVTKDESAIVKRVMSALTHG